MRTWVVISALVILLGGSAGASSMSMLLEAERRPATGYRKGRPIKLALVPIDWAEVEVRTARAYVAMKQAAADDGIELTIRSGFRTQEQQAWLYQAWRAGVGNRAARPGHSNHQSGRALDLVVRDPVVLAWLEANARRFGFRRTVKSEPWHWEHWPARSRSKKPAARLRPSP